MAWAAPDRGRRDESRRPSTMTSVAESPRLHVIRGPILIPIRLLIIAITLASFFLNAVFAFAIERSRKPNIWPAVADARRHATPIVASGVECPGLCPAAHSPGLWTAADYGERVGCCCRRAGRRDGGVRSHSASRNARRWSGALYLTGLSAGSCRRLSAASFIARSASGSMWVVAMSSCWICG